LSEGQYFKNVGFFDESLKNADDIGLWREFAMAGKLFAFIEKVEHLYRKRAFSISSKDVKRFPSIISIL
jgi:hypothetical protein